MHRHLKSFLNLSSDTGIAETYTSMLKRLLIELSSDVSLKNRPCVSESPDSDEGSVELPFAVDGIPKKAASILETLFADIFQLEKENNNFVRELGDLYGQLEFFYKLSDVSLDENFFSQLRLELIALVNESAPDIGSRLYYATDRSTEFQAAKEHLSWKDREWEESTPQAEHLYLGVFRGKKLFAILHIQSSFVVTSPTRRLARALISSIEKILQLQELIQDRIDKVALEQEVAAARKVYSALISTEFQDFQAPMKITHCLRPARDMAGDFLELFMPNDSTVDLLLGDVMGKGMDAAVIGGAAKKAYFEAIARVRNKGLEQISEVISCMRKQLKSLLQSSEAFITLTLVRIHTDLSLIEYVNCGNPNPIMFSDDISSEFKIGYPPFGAFFPEPALYPTLVDVVLPGSLAIFSDGLLDSYGGSVSRLRSQLLQVLNSPNAIHDATTRIIDELGPQPEGKSSDDISLIIAELVSSPTSILFSFEGPLHAERLSMLRDQLRQQLEHVSKNSSSQFLPLVLHELASNLIQHAVPRDGTLTSQIEVSGLDRGTLLKIRSNTAPYALSEKVKPSLRERGYGSSIIRNASVKHIYGQDENGNALTVVLIQD